QVGEVPAEGGEPFELLERAVAGVDLGDHLDPGVGLEQRPQARPHHGVVVHHHHANAHRSSLVSGRLMPTAVPSPGLESIATVPPAAAIRERSSASPSPPSRRRRTAAGSKPRPSSTTSRLTRSGHQARVSTHRSACACWSTLATSDCAARCTVSTTAGGGTYGSP